MNGPVWPMGEVTQEVKKKKKGEFIEAVIKNRTSGCIKNLTC